MQHRVNLLDTLIDQVDIRDVSARLAEMVREGGPHQIVTVNVDFIRLGAQDPAFRALINTSDLVVADGMPLVWASRLGGNPLPQRITGTELIFACARLAAQDGLRVFLLGAAPGVAMDAAATLRERFPGIGSIESYSPPAPVTPLESEKAIRLIQEQQPHMLFVAFGAPRQDDWIRAHLHRLNVPICIGVGGALDMLAGRVRRAPRWMQQAGLEWLFRVLQEPGRLWRRYLIYDLPVFFRLMVQSVGLRRRAATPTMDLRGAQAFGSELPAANIDQFPLERSDAHIA